jgi:hypothetical protein
VEDNIISVPEETLFKSNIYRVLIVDNSLALYVRIIFLFLLPYFQQAVEEDADLTEI